jgi:hypothetical protein
LGISIFPFLMRLLVARIFAVPDRAVGGVILTLLAYPHIFNQSKPNILLHSHNLLSNGSQLFSSTTMLFRASGTIGLY